jgi:thiamine kinase-like enzyme
MRNLLNALIATRQHNDLHIPQQTHRAYGWVLQRASAGMNGIVYRVTRPAKTEQLPLALKMSQRDERQRTLREFSAMRALWYSGQMWHDIAPYPLNMWRDVPELEGDVVIMAWLSGTPLATAPAPSAHATWYAVLDVLARIHQVTPDNARIKLMPAAVSVHQPADLGAILQQRRRRFSTGQWGGLHSDEIDDLMHKALKAWGQPRPIAPASLTLNDSNPANFIYDEEAGKMRVVDWANSGWCEGSFDVADMLAQPSYIDLPDAHKAWVRTAYAEVRRQYQPDATPDIVQRIHDYERLMWVFWLLSMTAFLANYQQPRLEGVQTYDEAHFLRHQEIYASRLRSALDGG